MASITGRPEVTIIRNRQRGKDHIQELGHTHKVYMLVHTGGGQLRWRGVASWLHTPHSHEEMKYALALTATKYSRTSV